MEVGRNLQQCVQHERPRLRDGLFHRQHAADVVADAQLVVLGFDVGIHYLIVEKLCGLQLAGNEPVIIIQQTAKKRELSLLIQDLDLRNRVVIFCERYVGVRFEEVLVNMEAWAKRCERRFQPLHCIVLFRMVKTFVVHTGNTENHA
jgi:hypothetical protein